MKRIWGLLVLILAILVLAPLARNLFANERAFNPDNLVRIHIIAHSNTPEDQRIKLRIRDRIVAYMSPKLSNSPSAFCSALIVRANMPAVAVVVRDELERCGREYGQKIVFGVFDFPTRHYGAVTVPQGRYRALRVILGSGQGRNWWCVLYPPFCFGQAHTNTRVKASIYIGEKSQKAGKRSAARGGVRSRMQQ